MPERGGQRINDGSREKSKETFRKLFLNKWTALLGAIVAVWAIKLELDGPETQKVEDKVESRLRLDEDALPKEEEDARRGIEAIETLHRALQDAAARSEAVDNPNVASDEVGDEPRVVKSELIEATPLYVTVKEELDNGLEWYKKYDLTYPDEETVTDENYAAIKDYFKSDCPGWTVER